MKINNSVVFTGQYKVASENKTYITSERLDNQVLSYLNTLARTDAANQDIQFVKDVLHKNQGNFNTYNIKYELPDRVKPRKLNVELTCNHNHYSVQIKDLSCPDDKYTIDPVDQVYGLKLKEAFDTLKDQFGSRIVRGFIDDMSKTVEHYLNGKGS